MIMAMAKSELYAKVEGLIDSAGLGRVITAFAEICYEKAEHIRENWQDNVTARSWERVGNQLGRVEAVAGREGF